MFIRTTLVVPQAMRSQPHGSVRKLLPPSACVAGLDRANDRASTRLIIEGVHNGAVMPNGVGCPSASSTRTGRPQAGAELGLTASLCRVMCMDSGWPSGCRLSAVKLHACRQVFCWERTPRLEFVGFT